MGGFRLTKWLSNSRKVLKAIPESELASSVVNLNPDDTIPDNKTLGIVWDVNEDKIKFKVKIPNKPHTRRGMLSVVSSIFDPLGLISPVTLKAKTMVQNLCRARLGWDDSIPRTCREEWKSWLDTLPELETLSIDRCFQPLDSQRIKTAELHVFSDGSEIGYGACAYLRLTDMDDKISCSLILGKSRLATLKQMSISRLELSGAIVACRLYTFISNEMELKIDQVTFWTDSTIVLGYISNTTRRFKTFVGNRLSVIHSLSQPEKWQHIESSLNPADIASRGIDARDSHRLQVWLEGPEFLKQDKSQWPSGLPKRNIEVSDNDVEIKKEVAVHHATCDTLANLSNYFSDLTKLRRVVAWLIRFKNYCRHRFLQHDVKCEKGDLTLNEIEEATETILIKVQHNHFEDEFISLQRTGTVKRDSKLANLNPVVDDGLIRAKGRVKFDSIKLYPIILPGKDHVTKLIIRFYHETQGHVGQQQVLADTRKGYWITNGLSTVKGIVRSCVPCTIRAAMYPANGTTP